MTTFYIQNAGSSNTDVTATFMPCADQGTGSACLGRADGPFTYQFTGLEPGKMVVIDATLARNTSNTPIPAGNGSYGSLVVTSSSAAIAGAVMEHHIDASPATYLKAVAGFTPSQYDTKYFVPQIKSQYPVAATTNACNSKWSSVMVQNASAGPVDVTVTYQVNENLLDSGRVGTSFQDTRTIDPDETEFFMTFQQPDFHVGDLASATVDASDDVVVMVNEEMRWECTNADLKDLASWAAIPNSAATNRISIPFYKQEYAGKFQGLVVQNVSPSAATYTVTVSVVGSFYSAVNPGDVYQFTHTDSVASGGAKTFVMPCMDVATNLSSVSGDYHDLCNSLTSPTQGTNAAIVVESAGNIVGVVTEEKGWWKPASAVGDGHSEDAGMYTAIPLN
jgi:hypothetical protein